MLIFIFNCLVYKTIRNFMFFNFGDPKSRGFKVPAYLGTWQVV